jgi:F-type H+-transporting ATPase subunit a
MHKDFRKIGLTFVILLAFILIPNGFAFGIRDKDEKDNSVHTEHKKEKFDPGSFIFDHVADSYEWHIFNIKEFHASIPLPVIVYSKESGLHSFWSSKLHHGHSEYKGFRISQTEPDKGKIVEILEDGTELKPLDFSITKNVFAIFISLGFLLWIFISIARKYEKSKVPSGFQNAMEPLILFIRDDVAKPAIGEEKYEKFMPFLLTVFFFVLINNLLGLIPVPPGGANVTGNLAVTGVLAFFTLITITINGNKFYWREIFNAPGVPWWLKIPIPLMPIIEILGMFTKPFVLMVRLFANIAAGHIIAMGFFSLIFIFGDIIPYLGYAVSPVTLAFTVFMSVIELLVAFVQAYVFTLLSALYFGMATAEHH